MLIFISFMLFLIVFAIFGTQIIIFAFLAGLIVLLACEQYFCFGLIIAAFVWYGVYITIESDKKEKKEMENLKEGFYDD